MSPTSTKNMSHKSALFTNYTNEEFTGYWDGKAKKFKAGESLWMPDYLARHFAKHLTNQELQRVNEAGSLIVPNGDKFTSPKNPDQVPQFMQLFNQAYTPEEETEGIDPTDIGNDDDDVEELIDSSNKNRAAKVKGKTKATKKIVVDDDDDAFPNKPKD